MRECCSWDLFAEGAEAIDEILSKVARVDVFKALDPLHPKDYEAIVRKLAKDLKGKVIPVEHAALKSAVSALDVDWATMTAAQRQATIDAAKKYLGPPVAKKALPAIAQTLSGYAKDIVPATKSKTILTYDLSIGANLNAIDDRISKFVIASQGHFIKDEFGQRQEKFSAHAQDIVAGGLARGLGSADIAQSLYEKLGPQTGRSEDYWNIIAMVFANRARTMTQLASFHEAGILEFTWESVLDEATSVQCRFLHGRTFSVPEAMQNFDQVEQSEDPEEIKSITPFMQFGQIDGKPSLYLGTGSDRTLVAHVTKNAVGLRDERGEFSNEMADEALRKAGVHAPPIHGRCRSTILPSESSSVSAPAPAPPLPVAAPPKPTAAEAKAKALSRLKDASENGQTDVDMTMMQSVDESPAFEKHPAFDDPSASAMAALWEVNGASKKPKIDDLIPTIKHVDEDAIAALIKSPKKLDAAPTPKIVIYQGKKWIVEGHDSIIAQRLLGQNVAYCHVVDLDKKLKPFAAPEPPPLPAPVVPPTKPSAEPGKASVILGEKLSGPKGSNEGGVYRGIDGVERYVKFYTDKSQAAGEHLANGIYKDLGLGGPDSTVFEHDGKLAYASKMISGLKTLEQLGVNEERARDAMKGFVADVLTGNWDAVGMSLDNMGVVDGKLMRLDNGGTFLMRAKAGRKDPSLLNAISEWEVFFSPKNPAYSKVAGYAGITSPEDFKHEVVAQIKAVVALRDSSGGWAKYIERTSPLLSGEDRDAIVHMLESRSKLLEGKLAELTAPPLPRKPMPGPGEVNVFGFDSKHGETLRQKLKSHETQAFVQGAYKVGGVSKADQEEIAKSIDKWTGEYKDAPEHKRVYAAARHAIAGEKETTDFGRALTRVKATRQERWREVLDRAGLKDAPTPTHFDLVRGMGGRDFVADITNAWKDERATHVTIPSFEAASWSFETETGQNFARDDGVVFRWKKCPIENTLMDQVVDDRSFLTSFNGEHEVIAGSGDEKGVRLPKEDQTVRFNGKSYTYKDRQKLFEAMKAHGFKP